MAISAKLVKELRERTAAGMMDCKKALEEAGGDIDKAQKILKEKGQATLDKKSGRIAAEGVIGSYIHNDKIGVIVESILKQISQLILILLKILLEI